MKDRVTLKELDQTMRRCSIHFLMAVYFLAMIVSFCLCPFTANETGAVMYASLRVVFAIELPILITAMYGVHYQLMTTLPQRMSNIAKKIVYSFELIMCLPFVVEVIILLVLGRPKVILGESALLLLTILLGYKIMYSSAEPELKTTGERIYGERAILNAIVYILGYSFGGFIAVASVIIEGRMIVTILGVTTVVLFVALIIIRPIFLREYDKKVRAMKKPMVKTKKTAEEQYI